MIISEDHILQAEPNNLIRILLARAYPLHLVIKNIKKTLDPQPQLPVISTNTTYKDQHSSHYNPSLRRGQTTDSHHTQKLAHFCQRHHNLHHLAIQPTPNPTLFTLHKNRVAHGKTPRTTTHTPIRTYPHITTVVTPAFSSIPGTPNSS